MTGIPDPAARSPDEAALLTAVLADLPNDLPRLVYADWLDDRDDPRGEFLRRFTHAVRTGVPLPDYPAAPPGWLELTGINLIRGLVELGYADRLGPFLSAADTALRLTPVRFGRDVPALGESRFGGQPDLPSDIEWPRTAVRPLAFLAQFDFAEFAVSPAARPLPSGQRLAVFYDSWEQPWDGGDGFRLVTFDAVTPLIRRPWPAGLDRWQQPSACRLKCVETLTVPAFDSPHLDRLPLHDDAGEYFDLASETAGGHQLLGHPRPIQGDVFGESDRRLLLELNSDELLGWCWGDSGALYLQMPSADLAVGRFDRVSLRLQCY